jgi:ATP-binding cassette subfamily A (ABC1) protein 3
MINFFFLGVGYHLILSKDANSDANQIFQLVQHHVEQAKLESAIGAECKILLPHGSSAKFPNLFEDLEKYKDNLQIFSIGLSETSIEEVFMKMYLEKKNTPKFILILILFLI